MEKYNFEFKKIIVKEYVRTLRSTITLSMETPS